MSISAITGTPAQVNATHATNASPAGDAKMMDACRQFEAYFFDTVLHEMRQSVPHGGVIPYSHAEQMFQEQLDTEYATQMSKTQSLGFAAQMYRQLSSHLAAAAPMKK